MSKASEWKAKAVQALEDLRHRPSADSRAKAGELLVQADGALDVGQASRTVAVLAEAVRRYDRNNSRGTK